MSDPKCICPYVGSTWHEGPMVREYHQEQDPNCPVHPEPRDRPYEITLSGDGDLG